MDERRTLADLHALDGLVVHRAGARLDELVALDAQVEHLRALYSERHKLLQHIVHNVGRGLSKQVRALSLQPSSSQCRGRKI